MRILVTCPYGISSLLSQEIKKIGYQPEQSFPTGILLECGFNGIMEINYLSRLANKVYIEIFEGDALDFNQLYDGIKGCVYAQYSSNKKLSIKVRLKNSQLNSQKSVQSVAHKALLDSISHFGVDESYTEELLLIIENNVVHLYLNTSGKALYQRGYKSNVGEAPLKENLACALLLLAGWRFKSPLIDPFCGSGTIGIEAALLAKNKAPGQWRNFSFERFKNFDGGVFLNIKQKAKDNEFHGEYCITCSDINSKILEIAKTNARNAGVADCINFKSGNFLDYPFKGDDKSWVICNPPYGKRIKTSEMEIIYSELHKIYCNNIFGGRISSYGIDKKNQHLSCEKKLYNGADQCYFTWRPPV